MGCIGWLLWLALVIAAFFFPPLFALAALWFILAIVFLIWGPKEKVKVTKPNTIPFESHATMYARLHAQENELMQKYYDKRNQRGSVAEKLLRESPGEKDYKYGED